MKSLILQSDSIPCGILLILSRIYWAADCPVKVQDLLCSLFTITVGTKLTFVSSFKDQLLFIVLLKKEDGTMKS